MVDPVSRISPSIPPPPTDSPYLHPTSHSTSTLSSYDETPGLIVQLFSAIISFFKWIFDISGPETPEIDRAIDLSQGDPFCNKIFSFSQDGFPSLRAPRKYELACKIFQTLGAGGPIHWLRNKWQLERWEKEILNMPGDPFEFLYFLTESKTMTEAMISFKKIALSSSERGLCYLVGRRPWAEFIGKQSESFSLRGSAEMISGFCQLLKLDPSIVSSHFKAKKWEELIEYVLDQRKNHFLIN
ncbi:MAG: hypothetical protein JSS30_08020 [Verrucomicrobia bacterium]|nr:hypothetical protein [Verrucomicrobiota bacterium]